MTADTLPARLARLGHWHQRAVEECPTCEDSCGLDAHGDACEHCNGAGYLAEVSEGADHDAAARFLAERFEGSGSMLWARFVSVHNAPRGRDALAMLRDADDPHLSEAEAKRLRLSAVHLVGLEQATTWAEGVE